MLSSTQVTVRLPADLAELIPGAGKRSTFIIDAIREKVAREKQAAIAASLASLAYDDEANDISDFTQAQSKVMARGD